MKTPNDIRLIRLECGKANAIDDRLIETLQNELGQALDDGARAVVVTGYGKYFSAGLNMTGLPNSRRAMLRFAKRFDDALLQLFRFPLPLVAAVNGHAIAGGCVLLSTCDFRIGAEGDYRIGVTEVELGVAFPAAALGVVRNAVNPSWTTDVILGARLMSPQEALQSGLLHEVTPPDQLLSQALAQAERLGSKPQPGFQMTKRALHEGLIRDIERQKKDSYRNFVDCWFSEPVTKRRLAMRSKKP
jgi:enoyl-CoA hydratase